jgi:hypothetical protein
MATQTAAQLAVPQHNKARAFQLRRFSTLVLAGAFLVMLVSGTVLFFGPHGSAARALEWTWLGLDRIEWRAIHGAMAGLFVLAGAVHVWLNRKPLFTYLKQRAGSHLLVSPEVYLALAVIAAFIVAAWMGWIPLGMHESAGGGGGGGGGLGLGRGRWGL